MFNSKIKTSAAVLFLLILLFLPFSSYGENGSSGAKDQIKLKELTLTQVTEFLLAAGALGLAAMAVAEGFKSCWLTPIGFGPLRKNISWANRALEKAYGPKYEEVLESLYRQNRSKGDLPRILRQGVRIGLNTCTAEDMASIVGDCTPEQLKEVAEKAAEGGLLKKKNESAKDKAEREAAKNTLGRFEVAADARIDAALSLAERHYTNGMRFCSLVVALILSISAAWLMGSKEEPFEYLYHAIILGLIAVPIAPIAKDLTKGLQSATRAIKAVK